MENNLFQFLVFYSGTIVAGILILSALSHMVYQQREPTSMIAWLLAIILLPYLAVPVYFIFRSRKLTKKIKSQFALTCRGEIPSQEATSIDLILRNNLIAGATRGNRFKLHSDGVQTFHTLIKEIEKAKNRILFSTYVISSDSVSKQILSALTRKAKQGVEIKLLIDCIGSLPLYLNQWSLRPLKKAGGKILFYMPLLARPFQNYINLRNHRKIYLFDDTTVLTGGMNLSREYMGPEPCDRRWQDILFRVQGPAVFHYIEIFTADWNHTSKIKMPWPSELPQTIGDTIIQVVPSGPDIASDALYEALLSAVFAAKKQILIVTPYFVPDKGLMQALIIAHHRGVDIKLITPASSNHMIADLSRSSYMRELENNGIRIHLYQQGMIHAKAIMFDQKSVVMGSANIDQRSLFLNYEVVSFIYSAQVIKETQEWMEKLLNQCRIGMEPAGRLRKMGENLMNVFAPLL